MSTENTRSLPHWHAESWLLPLRRHNVLIEGPVEATSAALLQMQPHIPERLSGSLLKRRSSFLAASQAR
jgi:hypothetical protein